MNLGDVETKVMALLHEENRTTKDLFGDYVFLGVQSKKNVRSNKYYTFYRPGHPENKNIHISSWAFNEQFVEFGRMSLKKFISNKEKHKKSAKMLLPPVSVSADSTIVESDSDSDQTL